MQEEKYEAPEITSFDFIDTEADACTGGYSAAGFACGAGYTAASCGCGGSVRSEL